MSLTPSQQEAVLARGDVIVAAGAGTGKTRTLVERCLDCLAREAPPVGMDELLLVTFTEAAAAEMRQRIRVRLEEQLKSHPESQVWRERLALFDSACIGTLHSFCFKLIREHFYELELDPQLSVLTSEETALLASETLSQILEPHYASESDFASDVRDLMQDQRRGRDKDVRSLILRLHAYSQTLPDAEGWFQSQLALLQVKSPELWRDWLRDFLPRWQREQLAFLARLPSSNEAAATIARLLSPDWADFEKARKGLTDVQRASEAIPHGKRTTTLKPLEKLLAEAAFLSSVLPSASGADPLPEDWTWVRKRMTTLLRLADEFRRAFTESKRQLGMVDFHDLEQYALKLLWDSETGKPSGVALAWRERLRFVFVDEYQDINTAQDRIIEALSREGSKANRFLVGDIKQSIYRFRLANPRIFQNYLESWHSPRGSRIALTDNFRSHPGVLQFVNSVFETVMSRELGGVTYDDQARLRPGKPLADLEPESSPRVELQLRIKRPRKGSGSEDAEGSEIGEADWEARMVARRLSELKRDGTLVHDAATESLRPATWKDMAILLRAPSGKAEIYAREFARLGLPLQVARAGFYESTEILDLIQLLRMLDNPLQDIPVLAVLRSPLAGLRLDDLAIIRLSDRGAYFAALIKWHESATEASELRERVQIFLDRFARWRRMAGQTSLSRCLESILAETCYDDWLLATDRGTERNQNVQRFLGIARQFDRFQRQGLFRFLTFLEAREAAESEPEAGPLVEEDAVRLMSIHRSKGLEFPIVVLADLAKTFNLRDLQAELVVDEEYGLCPQIKSSVSGRRYPSLPYWLAARRQARELRGEELRLMYVAMTRARDRLVLAGSVTEKNLETGWDKGSTPKEAADANSYSDWVSRWAVIHGGPTPEQSTGSNRFWSWEVHLPSDKDETGTIDPGEPSSKIEIDAGDQTREVEALSKRLSWTYPYREATRLPAKVTVTALRRGAGTADETQANFETGSRWPRVSQGGGASPRKAPAIDVGRAQHRFLQLVDVSATGSRQELEAEARRMVAEGTLTEAEFGLLEFDRLRAFWQSDLGERFRVRPECVRRELAFTARLTLAEVAALLHEPPPAGKDFVVVQGAADLVRLEETEIELVDFKTDQVTASEAQARADYYRVQLQLYSLALGRIYGRPITGCWLYFLEPGTAVEIKAPTESPLQKG